MKKLFIIFILSVFLLIPSTAMALVIGDIDFSLVDYTKPLAVVNDADTGFTTRVHPYPMDSIKVFHVLGISNPAFPTMFSVAEVHYLRDGILNVYKYNHETDTYTLFDIDKSEVERISKELRASLLLLKGGSG